MPEQNEPTSLPGRGRDDQIDVGSMVSHRDKKGRVEIRWGLQHAQLDIADARGLAMQILDAANAAETDAFLVAFLGRVGIEPGQMGAILNDFRRFRVGQLVALRDGLPLGGDAEGDELPDEKPA